MTVLFNNDGLSFTGVSADVGPFNVLGGRYAIALKATWGGGSATLQVLMPDASSYVTCLTAFSADGSAVVDLPPGTFKITVATATALQGFLVRIPIRP